jgi:5-carboxymethyl-2-hydroxymuconate isomerase
MPHFVIECSASILRAAPADDLMQAVYAAAESTGLFARSGVGGTKVRVDPYTHLLNATYFNASMIGTEDGDDSGQ